MIVKNLAHEIFASLEFELTLWTNSLQKIVPKSSFSLENNSLIKVKKVLLALSKL